MWGHAHVAANDTEEVPLVAVHAFEGGPLHGARFLWIVSDPPLRARKADGEGAVTFIRGEVCGGDLGTYRVARRYAAEDEWVVELRWIGCADARAN